MILKLSAGVFRRRMLILLVAVAVTALVALSVALGAPPEPAAAVLLILSVLALVLGLAIMAVAQRAGQQHPAFEVEDGLRSPRTGTFPLLAVTFVAVIGLAFVIPAEAGDARNVIWGTSLFCVVFLSLCAPAIRNGTGVTLTEEGLRADKVSGTVVAPWEAIDPERIWSRPLEVRLQYSRPDLVRTTGWVVNAGQMRVDGIPPGFVAATIQHYVVNQEERVLIGSPAGQLHWLSEPTEPRTAAPTHPGIYVTLIVLCLLALAGAVLGDRWVGAEYGHASLAGLGTHVATVALILFTMRMIRGSVHLLRKRA